MSGERIPIHAYLDESSHVLLQAFADANGVSITGLVQAFVDDLGAEMKTAGTTEIRSDLVLKARRIDASRRRR